jgi:hypothetical protein
MLSITMFYSDVLYDHNISCIFFSYTQLLYDYYVFVAPSDALLSFAGGE